jgi:hypothetical protein
LSRLHRGAHKADVNWAPLSDVMVASTQTWDPTGEKCPGAVGGGDGGERDCLWPPRCSVNHSEQVMWPGKGGRGPTRSTWMCAKPR